MLSRAPAAGAGLRRVRRKYTWCYRLYKKCIGRVVRKAGAKQGARLNYHVFIADADCRPRHGTAIAPYRGDRGMRSDNFTR